MSFDSHDRLLDLFEKQGIVDKGQQAVLDAVCEVLCDRIGPFSTVVAPLPGSPRGVEVTLTFNNQQVSGLDHTFQTAFFRAAFYAVYALKKGD